MTKHPKSIHQLAELRAQLFRWKTKGLRIGLVPTMGALHAGHLSLVQQLGGHVDRIIVSIFVNPTQFGKGEDFSDYPRDLDGDLEKLSTTPANLVYAPETRAVYPSGFDTQVTVGRIGERWEGEHRPGHFSGVATIVTKLFNHCQPDVAVFGEKDFQQLAVIRQIVRDMGMNIEIIGAPIIRESDGLAMSSRNQYLDPKERDIAGTFNKVLKTMCKSAISGKALKACEDTTKQELLALGFNAVDYIQFVNPVTLDPVSDLTEPAHVIAVARIGKVRLLDNMAVNY